MDGLTLCLDAAAGDGTIALLRDGTLIGEHSVVMRSEHEERFLPAVVGILASAGVQASALARVVCGEGPGSFTSLRVVAAAAKGLALGIGCPLFAVPSLALIVAAEAATAGEGRWIATLDAMRGDRHAALVEVTADGTVRRVEGLGLLPAAEIAARAAALGAPAIGPDELRVARPHARGVARAAALVLARGAVDLASWEPVYGRLAEAQVQWELAHGRPLR